MSNGDAATLKDAEIIIVFSETRDGLLEDVGRRWLTRMVDKKRSRPSRWFLLVFLPPLFFFSFIFIRGNDIERRVPILSPTIANSTCQIANPSLSVFDSIPYGVIEEGATGIAFFHTSGDFGECTMNFLNGSWHSHAHLNASTTSTKPIVVGVYGTQRSDPNKIILGGRVDPLIMKLQAVLPNGSKVQVTIHNDLFYAWISSPSSSPVLSDALVLRGSDGQGNLIESLRPSANSSSNA